VPSATLPKVRADGVVVPPGSKVTGGPPHVTPYVAPSPAASPAAALGPSRHTSNASAQAALPDADRPRRGAT
jgi:hypothetical protein